jgi:hypothetical protein
MEKRAAKSAEKPQKRLILECDLKKCRMFVFKKRYFSTYLSLRDGKKEATKQFTIDNNQI